MAVGTVLGSAAVGAQEAEGSGRSECWSPKCVWEILGQGLSLQLGETASSEAMGSGLRMKYFDVGMES